MNIGNIKKRKILMFLASVLLVSFLLGILFLSIVDKEGKLVVTTSINSYFNTINNNKIEYLKSFVTILSKNITINSFIWLIGISIIGVGLVIIFLLIKSFLVGFSLSSILYTYGFKGIFLTIIYIFPELIELFIFFVLSYYSIDFSIFTFNSIIKKKEYNKKIILNRYVRVFLVTTGAMFINSIIKTILIPNILKVI